MSSSRQNESAYGPSVLDDVFGGTTELHRLFLETSNDTVAIVDESTVFLFVSPGYERLIGRTAEQLLGSPGMSLVHPEDLEYAQRSLAEILEHDEATVSGLRMVRGDDSVIVIDCTLKRILAPDGRGVIIAFTHDVTDRARALGELHESRERYRSLVEGIEAIVWEADPETLTFSFVSPRAVEVLGYPLEEWYEPGFWRDRLHPDDRENTVAACVDAVSNAADHELLYRMVSATGTDVWLRDLVRVVVVDGRVELLRGVMMDVTAQIAADEERERLEEELRQAQKLDAIGRLAGAIAHDFNNLITAVRGYAELALAEAGADPVRGELQEIRGAAERAAGLTRQLLAFSRRQELAPEQIDLNQVVLEMAGMLQRLIGTHVELVIDLAPRLRLTEADPSQMQQIVLNLTLNARDAMPSGGRLDLKTANVHRQGRRFVAVSVADTGVGMDAATRERLFEPFFTTKEMGEGTGLGLSTVYGIVKQSGGEIAVESEPGRGTRFRILLPATEGDQSSSRS